MKAPDKIYLTQGFDLLSANKDKYITPDIDKEWSIEKEWSKKNLEYIRKDALLEWLNEARAIPHENAIARDLAFQEVVNKLNSM